MKWVFLHQMVGYDDSFIYKYCVGRSPISPIIKISVGADWEGIFLNVTVQSLMISIVQSDP